MNTIDITFLHHFIYINTRLQTWMDASSDGLLPFAFSHSAIKDLDHVSPEFQEFLYNTEAEL